MSAAKKKAERPYGVGFNGHARKCDCTACAKARVEAVLDYVHNPTVKLGKPGATVLVKAYFRRHPNHMHRQPQSLALLRRRLRSERRTYGEEV